MADKFACPRRTGEMGPWDHSAVDDEWQERDGEPCCSFCGSLKPERFMEQLAAGVEIIPTDKNYKAYLRTGPHGQTKFYYQHLSEQQQTDFVELLNQGKIRIGYPGHLYNLPFFITPIKPSAA